jgi:nucleotide-binding universal stress UspA family protein
MTYKTILMHCNDRRRIDTILAPAVKVATTFQSHVIGLSVVPPVSVVSSGAFEAPPMVIDAHCELYRQDVAPMRQKFEVAMAGRPATFEWRDLDAGAFGVVDAVVEHGRTADLIVALQTDPDWPLTEWLDVADGVAVESGRPVLIIPNGRASDRIASRVLVAWNGRREAARAVFDALPLLQQASAVRIVRVREGDTEVEQPGADISQSLVRHGVKTDKIEDIEAAGTSAGAALLADADAFDADLVVMGCYGHSRLREFVFGGVTRHLLQKMRVPLLMSH